MKKLIVFISCLLLSSILYAQDVSEPATHAHKPIHIALACIFDKIMSGNISNLYETVYVCAHYEHSDEIPAQALN